MQNGTQNNIKSAINGLLVNQVGDRRLIVAFIFLLLIVLIGFDLRLQSVNQSVVQAPIRADAVDYYSYAYNLRHFGVYSKNAETWMKGVTDVTPDSYRSPGYSLFLAPFVDGPASKGIVDSILFAQVILSTITILFAYSLFRGGFPVVVSLIGAFLVALSPHLVTANIYVLTETLFCFFLVVTFWCLRKYLTSKRTLFLLLLGIFLACSSLVRPSSQYFIVPLLIFLFVFDLKGSWKKTLGMVFLGFAIVMSPWLIRNAIQDTGGSSLARMSIGHGMYPGLMYQDNPKSRGVPYRANPDHNTVTANADALSAEIWRRFTEEPGRHLEWFLFGKPVMLWSWNIIGGAGDVFVYPVSKTPYTTETRFIASHEIMKLLHTPLMLLGALGAVLVWVPRMTRKYSREAVFLLRGVSLFILYFTALHIIAAPFPRYSIPARPLMYIMSMFTIVIIYNWVTSWVNKGGVINSEGSS